MSNSSGPPQHRRGTGPTTTVGRMRLHSARRVKHRLPSRTLPIDLVRRNPRRKPPSGRKAVRPLRIFAMHPCATACRVHDDEPGARRPPPDGGPALSRPGARAARRGAAAAAPEHQAPRLQRGPCPGARVAAGRRGGAGLPFTCLFNGAPDLSERFEEMPRGGVREARRCPIPDTGPLAAVFKHREARTALFRRFRGPVAVPAPKVTGAARFLQTEPGPRRRGAFPGALAQGELIAEAATAQDFARIAGRARQCTDFAPGTTHAATVGHQRFRAVRPAHRAAFEPAETTGQHVTAAQSPEKPQKPISMGTSPSYSSTYSPVPPSAPRGRTRRRAGRRRRRRSAARTGRASAARHRSSGPPGPVPAAGPSPGPPASCPRKPAPRCPPRG